MFNKCPCAVLDLTILSLLPSPVSLSHIWGRKNIIVQRWLKITWCSLGLLIKFTWRLLLWEQSNTSVCGGGRRSSSAWRCGWGPMLEQLSLAALCPHLQLMSPSIHLSSHQSIHLSIMVDCQAAAVICRWWTNLHWHTFDYIGLNLFQKEVLHRSGTGTPEEGLVANVDNAKDTAPKPLIHTDLMNGWSLFWENLHSWSHVKC